MPTKRKEKNNQKKKISHGEGEMYSEYDVECAIKEAKINSHFGLNDSGWDYKFGLGRDYWKLMDIRIEEARKKTRTL